MPSWVEHEKSLITSGPCVSKQQASTTITKTRIFKYIENFTTKEMENFQIKNSDILHNSVQTKIVGTC